MKRILLIEDDKNIANGIVEYLKKASYQVEWVNTLKLAHLKLSWEPQLIVLDWMLPDGEGIDFLKYLRGHSNVFTPVIFLTAKVDLVDKILGLELGADDYMTKPFEARELLTRIRVRLREPGNPTRTSSLLFCGIELNLQSRTVKYLHQELELTKLEYDLLKLLMEEPERVFTREMILNKVWGFENFPTTRTVDNHIVQLRQKTHNDLFETVRGVGYRLRALSSVDL